METTTSDLYSILGIPKNADFITIRKAYLKLALKYHPDKNKDKDATMNFHSISNAYEILSNPEKREKYDKFGIVHEVEITEVPEEEILKKYENLNNMINREFQNERCAKITLILFVVAFSALFALAIYDLSNLESIGFISLGEVSFIIFGGIVYVAFIKVFDEYLKLTRNKLFESDKTKETNIINKIFSSPFEEYPLVFLVFFHSLQIALLPYRFSVLFVTKFIEKKNE